MLLAVVLTGYFAIAGMNRREFYTIDDEAGPRDYAVQEPKLRPLRMDRFHGPSLDEAIRYVTTTIPQRDAIMVLPDATLLYALTGRQSTAPLLWFHVGVTCFPGDDTDARLVEALVRRNVRWVLLEQRPQIPTRAPEHYRDLFPQFFNVLDQRFRPVAQLRNYTVLRRQDGRSP